MHSYIFISSSLQMSCFKRIYTMLHCFTFSSVTVGCWVTLIARARGIQDHGSCTWWSFDSLSRRELHCQQLRDLFLKHAPKFCFFWFILWYQRFAASIQSLMCVLYLSSNWYAWLYIFSIVIVNTSIRIRSRTF